MGIRQIAFEAYHRIQALEQLLVAKGIIEDGEAEKRYQDILNERHQQYKKLREDFWSRIDDGDYIEYLGYPGDSWKSWEGIVLAKSVKPWQVLTVEITAKRTSKLKEGSRFVLEPCPSESILVKHKNGEREQLKNFY